MRLVISRWLLVGVGICCVGLAAAAIIYGSTRWSARIVARELEDARRAEAAGEDRDAARHYDRYRTFAGAAADPDALVERALVALRLAAIPDALPGEIGRAEYAAFEAIRVRPSDMRLRRRLADLQISKGDFAGAREHLLVIRESIDAGTGDDDPAAIDLRLARTWLGTGDHRRAMTIVAGLTGFDEASHSFDKASSDLVPASGAYLLLAEILRGNVDDQASADAAVERCVRAHPDDTAALVSYSKLLLSRNDPGSALQAAARAARLDPDDPAVVVAHARALAATGDHQAADEAFIDGVRRLPNSQTLFAEATYHVAYFGTAEQILEILDGCWDRLSTLEHQVLAFIANMRINWKSKPMFAQRLEEARTKLGVDNPAVIVLEARVHEAQGEWTAADKSLVKARAIVPNAATSRIDELLARCLVMLDEPDAAIVVGKRLESEPATWWRATSAIAEGHLALGQTEAAAEHVDRLCQAWTRSRLDERVETVAWTIIPTLSTMIRVMAAQPAERRDWGGIESIVTAIANSPRRAADGRVAMARAELLAARGDLDAAFEAVPPSTETAPAPQFDSLRIALVEKRDGIIAMRAAIESLPRWRRAQAGTLAVAARAEAGHATGDDRDWLRSCAAASDGVGSAVEAVQLLQGLAGLARAAGWTDESRDVWARAAKRLPDDFRPHLALALDAARSGDAEAAAAAASRVVATQGAESARGRVATAASLIAAVRGAEGGRSSAPATASGPHDKRLQEARTLLQEAANERKRWQPVAVLLADVASLGGDPATAAIHLQNAVDYGPHDPRLVLDLAAAFERCLRRGDAERIRDTVAPAGVGGGDRLAIDAHIRAREFQAAAERAIVAIDAEKTDLPTLLWLGRLCSRAGLRERASELATRATKLDPASPDGWLRLVQCRLAEGDEDAAEAALAAGCEAVSPTQRRLLQPRGDAVVGRVAEAERGFRDAVRQSRNNAVSAAFLVDFLLQQGREKDADTFLQDVIAGGLGELPVLQKWAKDRRATLRQITRTQ